MFWICFSPAVPSGKECLQGVAVEIYCYAVCSLVLLAGICFLKSSIASNNCLTSLDCSRPDFWRSLIRLSELLLSSLHPDILVCHLFGADSLSKAALAIQNSILSTCIISFTVAIVCLSMRCGLGMECLSLFRHCVFLNCAF